METFLLCCVYNISLRIFHSIALLATNCLSLPWNVLVSLPILKDSFPSIGSYLLSGPKIYHTMHSGVLRVVHRRLHTFSLNAEVLKNLGSSCLAKSLHAWSHCLASLCTSFWCTSLWGIRLQVEKLRLREAKHLPGTMVASLTAGPGHRYRLLSSLPRYHGSLTVNTAS